MGSAEGIGGGEESYKNTTSDDLPDPITSLKMAPSKTREIDVAQEKNHIQVNGKG